MSMATSDALKTEISDLFVATGVRTDMGEVGFEKWFASSLG